MKSKARFLAVFCVVVTGASAPASPPVGRLEREFARNSRAVPGLVGITAIHVESGAVGRWNAGDRFPMASTYKVPIAVQLLHLVDEGQVRLDRMIEIRQRDLHPGSGTLSRLFDKPGLALSIRNLLELMLLISDNSASDILLRIAGGPQAVTDRMRALGIDGIRIDRSTLQLHADIFGVERFPPEEQWTPAVLVNAIRAVPAERSEAAKKRFLDDPLDTSTPEAMARLLVRVCRKDLLKRQSADLLLDIMQRCQTGTARIKGMLPAGTVVAHKPGLSEGVLNDVGIITLPEDAGHVAIAVFLKGTKVGGPACERAIAEASRAAYDFFLFTARMNKPTTPRSNAN